MVISENVPGDLDLDLERLGDLERERLRFLPPKLLRRRGITGFGFPLGMVEESSG